MSRTHWVIDSSPTTTSGQTAAMIASRSTTRPAFSTSSRRSAKDFGRSGTSAPSGPSKARRPRSRVKRSKRQAPGGTRSASIDRFSPGWAAADLPSRGFNQTFSERFTGVSPRSSGQAGPDGVLCARRRCRAEGPAEPPRPPHLESPDAEHPQDDPHPAMTATLLAGAVLMSGWLSVAMAGGGKWSG